MLSTIATREMIQEHISEYLDMMEKGEEELLRGEGSRYEMAGL